MDLIEPNPTITDEHMDVDSNNNSNEQLPQEENMVRGLPFPHTEDSNGMGISLMLAESSEAVRKQTLDWVSRAQFDFFRYSIQLTGFKTGFIR